MIEDPFPKDCVLSFEEGKSDSNLKVLKAPKAVEIFALLDQVDSKKASKFRQIVPAFTSYFLTEIIKQGKVIGMFLVLTKYSSFFRIFHRR